MNNPHDHRDLADLHLPAPNVPQRVSVDGLEERWANAWEEQQVYAFNREAQRQDVFSIDTPPPTASGSLHVGHVFSYTHTDCLARYQRMQGKAVFYPMGWDDNGLPTERRAQNYYGVRCDPSLAYDPNFEPPHHGDSKSVKARDQVPVSRKNFIELCEQLTKEDEKSFEALWRRLGLSVDWKHQYQTISKDSQKVAQAAFLRNLKRGEAYQAAAPGLWDVTFQTAVAQAELEARDYPGFYHALAFHLPGGEDVIIETTRPELLAACCCLVAHPDDQRYQHLFGKTVTSPGFNVEVPVLAHPAAEMDKGAGIAMCCTFGDVTDVEWWRDLELPTRVILAKDGRITHDPTDWITDPAGSKLMDAIRGKTTFSARQIVVEALKESGELKGEPQKTMRQTNFFEKGDKPLEIVMSRQWYIRNGGSDYTLAEHQENLNAELLKRGEELRFHPDFMKVRYANWVHGLHNDWLVSRQRFFGVPIPLWYRVDESGEVDYDQVLMPSEESLPIDPTSDVPVGFTEDQRGKAGGFTGEVDILDTWATSSLTPQIAGGWLRDEDLFQRVYPMDVRPQGQDIIRTWLFSTVVRAHLEFGALPFKNAAISGWILDPDRKKMSKSKGNVVTPMGLLEKHGSDSVRYWAAAARLGTDTAFEEAQMKIGRRLAMKLLNASKFALAMTEDADLCLDPTKVTTALDKAVIARLNDVICGATSAFDKYDHTRALEITESFFWDFCDNYLELVKNRAHNFSGSWESEAQDSARTALALVVDNVTRLLAPFLPYAAEEVWSWYRSGSVHTAPWPKVTPALEQAAGQAQLLELAGDTLSVLRKVKSEAKVGQRTPFEQVTIVYADDWSAENLPSVRADLDSAASLTGTVNIQVDKEAATPVSTQNAVLGTPPPKKPRN
ncbi:valine--tRNA ligase [Varibaculum cambriense]|uniref:valine--tRNA ligase n=1 Tax=Varibaculum cambriense TaxID=184870 RepID=UPI00290B44E9|nr:valine--tRNA ligase [Varibaculum cambriense]MDU5542073.1 valine--tRNA ligase [Varibaculum cambriense]